MRGSAERLTVVAAVAAMLLAGSAGAVSIDVGTALGAPGDSVPVPVSLRAEGATVIATQNRLDFGRDAFVGASANGQPDCAVNPAIDKEATGFRFVPLGCDAALDCSGVRVFVLSFQSLEPIADGVLYTCQVTIAADAAEGTYPLALDELGASAPGGVLLETDGTPGAVSVSVVREPAARIVVGEASGFAGFDAPLGVTLELLDPEAEVAEVQVDLDTNTDAFRVAAEDDLPSCAVNPALEKEASSFTFLPDGCDPLLDCATLRATIRSAASALPIADGALLFTCSLDLLGAAGTYGVPAANPLATDPGGGDVLALVADGSVVIGALPACAGDCDADRVVAINELLLGVNIVIGAAGSETCAAFDTDVDGEVTVAELIQAVNAALSGCPAPP